jgi:hypothetical protein
MREKLTNPGIALLLLLLSPAGHGTQCTAESGGGTTVLLELYTAEGCSSCPPAETWLNSLAALKLPAGQLAPLALHVDYWNDAWTDPYAQKEFSQRQYRATLLTGTTTAYTPQVLLNGRDYRWQKENLRATLERLHAQPARADLQLALAQQQPSEVEVTLRATLVRDTAPDDLALFVALYENNLQRHITGGENRGLTLMHQFVARGLRGPVLIDDKPALTVKERFKLDLHGNPRNMGIVAFVQNRRTNEVLQTVARGLCP